MLLNKFEVNAWFIVEAGKVCFGHKFHQVVVAGIIFCEQHEAVAATVHAGLFVMTCAHGHIGVYANDGLNTIFLARLVKLNGTIEVGIVGKGEGRHVILLRFFDERWNLRQGREEAVVTVCVEVDKTGWHEVSIHRFCIEM